MSKLERTGSAGLTLDDLTLAEIADLVENGDFPSFALLSWVLGICQLWS